MLKKISIRDLLLLVFTVAWIAAVGISLVTTQKVPAELWAVFTGAIGLILAAFRTQDSAAPTADESRPAVSETAPPEETRQ